MQIIDGDQKAFDAFYDTYVDRLFNYFYKRTRSNFQAEELTQLTFIKCWEYRHSLSPDLPLDMQLYYKARITYIDWLRKEAHQKKLLAGILGQEADKANEQDHSSGELEKARKALQQLPATRKKVMQLFYIDGYSYKEIAQMLGISPKTVDNHIYQGIAQVRKLIFLLLLFFSGQ